MLACVLAACGRGGPASILDAGPRQPDAEGVVEEVNPDRIRLDGGRVWRVDPQVESFTSGGHDLTPLARWTGRYVHIGLNDQDRVVWVAGIGIVAQQDPPVVRFSGVVDRVQDATLIFADGTVLRLAEGVEPPGRGMQVVVTIDPAARTVVSVQSA